MFEKGGHQIFSPLIGNFHLHHFGIFVLVSGSNSSLCILFTGHSLFLLTFFLLFYPFIPYNFLLNYFLLTPYLNTNFHHCFSEFSSFNSFDSSFLGCVYFFLRSLTIVLYWTLVLIHSSELYDFCGVTLSLFYDSLIMFIYFLCVLSFYLLFLVVLPMLTTSYVLQDPSVFRLPLFTLISCFIQCLILLLWFILLLVFFSTAFFSTAFFCFNFNISNTLWWCYFICFSDFSIFLFIFLYLFKVWLFNTLLPIEGFLL